MKTSFSPPQLTADLTGHVALITGASSGLGRRFAETLSAAGATVAVAGRRLERLKVLESEIYGRGGKALAVNLDIRNPDSIKDCVKHIEEKLGVITILINNSAILNTQPATEMELDIVDDLISTNFRGPFLLSQAVAKRLIAHNTPGRIINISSAGAFHHEAAWLTSLYDATKSALLRLTETLAMEWAHHNINVNAIAPGLFRTEMSEGYMQQETEVVQAFPRKRAGSPSHLDSTLLYLVSPSSEFITGICILADDGQYAR